MGYMAGKATPTLGDNLVLNNAGVHGILYVVVTIEAELGDIFLGKEFSFGAVRIVTVDAVLTRRHVRIPALSK